MLEPGSEPGEVTVDEFDVSLGRRLTPPLVQAPCLGRPAPAPRVSRETVEDVATETGVVVERGDGATPGHGREPETPSPVRVDPPSLWVPTPTSTLGTGDGVDRSFPGPFGTSQGVGTGPLCLTRTGSL